jgi:dephospho-CoA kinase
MLVVGLTGSVGMGKSTAVAMLRRMGIPVHDADAAVHRLIGPGGAAVGAIEAAFPGSSVGGAVDRRRLGDQIFGNPAARARLERILHPLVRRSTERFLKRQARQRRDLVVLDIPLLFETGGEALCDAVIVVSAPGWLQAARVLARPGMTAEKFRAIRAAQVSDAEKRRRADFVLLTGLSKGATLRRLTRIVTLLRKGGWKPCRRSGLRKNPVWSRHA